MSIRITQFHAQAVAAADPVARFTQVHAQAVVAGDASARLTQVHAQALVNAAPPARFTQIHAQALHTIDSASYPPNQDGGINDDGTGFDDGSGSLEVIQDGSAATRRNAFLRFANLPIPQGVAITHARLELTCTDATKRSFHCDVYGADQDDTPPFDSGANSPNTTPKTTATLSIADDLAVQDVGHVYTMAPLTAIVQEIVDRAGWSQGNAMGVMIFGKSIALNKSFAFSSAEGADPPQLFVVYEGAGTGGAGGGGGGSSDGGEYANMIRRRRR